MLTRSILKTGSFMLAFILCCFICASAQIVNPDLPPDMTYKVPPDLNTVVGEMTTVTYFDLAKKVFPDAKIDKGVIAKLTATTRIPLRNLLNKDYEENLKRLRPEISIFVEEQLETVYCGERESLLCDEKIFWLKMRIVGRPEGHPDSEIDDYILAAYSVGKRSANLIDAASVKTNDQTTLINIPALTEPQVKLTLTRREEAVIIVNTTDSAVGQNSFALIGLSPIGFRVFLGEFFLHYDIRCMNNFFEDARISVLRDAEPYYPNLEVNVTFKKTSKHFLNVASVLWKKKFRYVFKWSPETQSYQPLIDPSNERDTVIDKYRTCKTTWKK